MFKCDEEIEELCTIGLDPDNPKDNEVYAQRKESMLRKRNLAIQNYLAPDLVGEWEGG